MSSPRPTDVPHDSFYLSAFTADILQANDSLTQVINQYRQLVQGEDVSADDKATPQPSRCTRARVCSLSAVFLHVRSEDPKQMLCVLTRLSPGGPDGAQHISQHRAIRPGSLPDTAHGHQPLRRRARITGLAQGGGNTKQLVNRKIDDQALNKQRKTRGPTWPRHARAAGLNLSLAAMLRYNH